MKRDLDTLRKNAIVYDYSPAYKRELIDKIKARFSEECQKDDTLSEEYKRFVSSLENINVEINYGWDIVVEFNRLNMKVAYVYDLSYTTPRSISGTLSIDSYGNVTASDLKLNKDHRHTTVDRTEEIVLSSSDRIGYTSHLYSTYLHPNDLKNYVQVYDKTQMPSNLLKTINRDFINTFDEMVQKNPPSNAMEEAEKYVKSYNEGARNFSLVEINDYNINSAQLYYLPRSFDIWTEFDDEIYMLNDIFHLGEIVAEGKHSDHYTLYNLKVESLKTKRIYTLLPRVIGGAASLLPTLLLVVYYLQIMGLPNFFGIERAAPFTILLALISIAVTVMGIYGVIEFFKPFQSQTSPYDEKLPLGDLYKKVEKDYKKSFVGRLFSCAIMLIIYAALAYWFWLS